MASSVTSMLCVPAARKPRALAAAQMRPIALAWSAAATAAVAGSNAAGSRYAARAARPGQSAFGACSRARAPAAASWSRSAAGSRELPEVVPMAEPTIARAWTWVSSETAF